MYWNHGLWRAHTYTPTKSSNGKSRQPIVHTQTQTFGKRHRITDEHLLALLRFNIIQLSRCTCMQTHTHITHARRIYGKFSSCITLYFGSTHFLNRTLLSLFSGCVCIDAVFNSYSQWFDVLKLTSSIDFRTNKLVSLMSGTKNQFPNVLAKTNYHCRRSISSVSNRYKCLLVILNLSVQCVCTQTFFSYSKKNESMSFNKSNCVHLFCMESNTSHLIKICGETTFQLFSRVLIRFAHIITGCRLKYIS